jgi:integrase
MKMKITKSNLPKMTRRDGKPGFYTDTDLPGFGVKVNDRSKVYYVEKRVGTKTVRHPLAPVGTITPEEARKLAQRQLGIMASGVNINQQLKQERAKGITLREAFEEYIGIKTVTPKTIVEYSRAMRTTFADWENKAIGTINRDMIEKKFKSTSANSASVANSDFRFLRALLNFAMEKYTVDGEPLIPSNPCNRLTALKLWNRIERRTTYIRPAQIKSFFHGLSIAQGDTDNMKSAKNQCMLILFTGCREQEAARLRWRDINFGDRTVTFEITKNHRKHTLPIGTWLLDFLRNLSRERTEDLALENITKTYLPNSASREQAEEPALENEYLFPANNKSGHIKDHRKLILKIAEDCGVKFTLHDIRRTFASIVDHDLGQSFSPYTLKRLLNHSSQDVTAGYIQFGTEDLRRPMQLVEDFILENAGVREVPRSNVIGVESITAGKSGNS